MKVCLLSDLHIGSPQSKWRDAATLINRMAPDLDAIILIGDITEELNPYPKTLAFAKNDPNSLKQRILTALDQFIEKISEYVNKTVFLRGNHDDQVLNRCSIVENHAVLRSKFGRIIVLHGHQTNLTRYGLKLGWGVQSGRELKNNLKLEHSAGIELEATDYIIVGHCHVAYSDALTKIFSPGCWVGNYSNRNTGWYVLIDDEEADSPQSFIQMKRKANLYYRKQCECGFNHLTNDALICPACKQETTPRCGMYDCNRPLRGEEVKTCKRHHASFRFWE
ncbi:MAG: metallophosphoesterase family protein [Candidatus Helarchaeota archaeon]|nr:metallophosphoesterase family protein [Candidatus Helarchaeota archaeon]